MPRNWGDDLGSHEELEQDGEPDDSRSTYWIIAVLMGLAFIGGVVGGWLFHMVIM